MAASGSSGSTSTAVNRQVKRNAYVLFGVLHDTTLSLEEKLGEVTELLDGDNVDVNLADDCDRQNTLLHGAVKHGNVDIVRLLLKKGADIRIKNTAGETPLHAAVRKGFCGIVEQLLLSDEANVVNVMNAAGDTPLHLVAASQMRGRSRNKIGVNLVMLLVKHNADVNSQNADGKTPLYFAVEQSAKSVVKLLLDNSADVNVKAGDKTPLDLAKEIGNQEIMLMLGVHSAQHIEVISADLPLKVAAVDVSTLSYTPCGAKISSHGTLYQFHLLMCCLLRALNGYRTFHFGTEVADAKQFDDIVFKDLTDASNVKRQLFVQAKHKTNVRKGITASDLVTTHKDAEFSLLKYFKSYLFTKDKPEAEYTDLAICTNMCFAFKEWDVLIDSVSKLKVKLTLKEDTAFYKNIFEEGKCFKLVADDLSSLDKLFRDMVNNSSKGETSNCVQAKELKEFMKLDDDGRKECWKTFLSKFTFIVEQPTNESMIKKEFNVYVPEKHWGNDLLYRSFYTYMHGWSMKPEGEYLTAQSIKKKVDSNVTTIENNFVSEMSRVYVEELLNSRIAFTDSVLDELHQRISEHSIVHLIAPVDFRLTAIGVAQAIKRSLLAVDSNAVKTAALSKAADRFIFVTLQQLLLKDSTRNFIEAFKSSGSYNLLVIHVSSETSGTSLIELSDTLLEIITNNSLKKIVLIAPEDHPLPAMFNGCTRHNVTSVFRDLTPESQTMLLATSVTLQGQSVELSQVIGEDDTDLLDHVPLEELISDEGLVIGAEQPTSPGYDESFYIERSVINRIEIKAKIFQDMSQRKFCDLVAKTETEFKKLFIEHPRANVHWIREENSRFIWVQSEGKLNALDRYIDRSNSQSCSEDVFLESVQDQRVVIISDMAGMGKSTILSHISRKIKEKHPGKLVFRVDLNNFSQVLAERKSVKSDKSSAMDFLCKSLGTIKMPLVKELLKTEDKVVLLLDGFDEISPDYDDIVIDLIQDIKRNTQVQLWITTRPFMKESLENNLQQFSCSMQPFTEKNQIDFLTKYWKHMHGNDVDLEKLEAYATTLVQQLSSSINDKEREFTGIPLQVRMLAECYTDEATGSSAPVLGKQYQLIDLYKTFIQRKYVIFFKDKCKLSEHKSVFEEILSVFQDGYKKIHQWYACCLLFSKEETQRLFPYLRPDVLLVSTVNSIGIANVINDIPNFVHRTFAEYLCADFVVDLMKKIISKKMIDFVLLELLVQDAHLVWRAFLNQLLLLVKQKWSGGTLSLFGKRMKMFSVGNHNTIERIFYLTAKEGNQNILEYLCNALQYHSSTFKRLLLCKFPKNTIYGVIVRGTMLHVAANGGHDNYITTLFGCVHDFMDEDKRLVRRLLLSVDESGRTALHLAAMEGRVNAIVTLLNGTREITKGDTRLVRQLLLAVDEDMRTALHLSLLTGYLIVIKPLLECALDVMDGDKAVVSTLLSAVDESGGTGLHTVVSIGCVVSLQTLLTCIRDAMRGDNDLVREIVLAGDRDGLTALHLAAAQGRDNVMQTFLSWLCDAADGDKDLVRKIVLAVDGHGRTALLVAATGGFANVVQTILSWSRDVMASDECLVRDMLLTVDGDGCTALHWAVTGGHGNVIQTLLSWYAVTSCV